MHPIAASQTEYSVWVREPEEVLLPTLRELGFGFVPYCPLILDVYEADGAVGHGLQLGTRLIYAETVPLDESLLATPTYPVSTTTLS